MQGFLFQFCDVDIMTIIHKGSGIDIKIINYKGNEQWTKFGYISKKKVETFDNHVMFFVASKNLLSKYEYFNKFSKNSQKKDPKFFRKKILVLYNF
jgi:hypothetical protein